MKATSETLSPTRVKLTVEVPFEELKPSLDIAYKTIARQVKVQGFRPGKVPARVLDQRVGRGAILDEAMQDALPRFYAKAIEEQDVQVIGRPEVDVTGFGDGEPLTFTAEVDIRPEVTLPSYDKIPVSVDDVSIGDDEVDAQLQGLRDRFAVLEGVSRPIETGDYVSIDLSATVDGEPVEGADAQGLSYEVGSGTLVAGIDEALVGKSEGDAGTFDTELVAGEYAGRTAQVAVTVRSVKVKNVPDLDDEFAQTASEFDTIAELRADVRSRIERVRRLEQGVQARDHVLDALLERVDVPLPQSIVEAEHSYRAQSTDHQLEQAGLTREAYLEAEGKTAEEWDAELRKGAEVAVKAQFVLDAIAEKEQLGVSDAELTDQVVRRAQRLGMSPDQYANQVVSQGQLGVLMSEVLRGKALALVLEQAVITDASGNAVDLSQLSDGGAASVVAEALADEDLPYAEDEHDHDHGDHEGHDHGDHEGHDHG